MIFTSSCNFLSVELMFWWNIGIYLDFPSFVDIDIVQADEILHPMKTIQWLLMFWQHKEPAKILTYFSWNSPTPQNHSYKICHENFFVYEHMLWFCQIIQESLFYMQRIHSILKSKLIASSSFKQWDISRVQWEDVDYHADYDVIKWKYFLLYWTFVRGIHRSPVSFPHKGQWRRALMFSLICAWINGRVNNREAGDLRCHHAHYDVISMYLYPKINQYYDWNSIQLDEDPATTSYPNNYIVVM